MHAVVVCSECDKPIDVREIRAQPGPGYRADHEPSATVRRPSDDRPTTVQSEQRARDEQLTVHHLNITTRITSAVRA
jgi:hypothetical protein